MRIENKKYFVDTVNSSKAFQFTCLYHYSHLGFKKAKVNLGIYDKKTNELKGVLQWGCSAQEGIRLDRYVKEPIKKEEYLELNRFCMKDDEGKNAESQAISLGVKWLKKNMPEIKLLVSYSGRREGKYGYIYQATNWEYLGYFVSNGFWLIDGIEKHSLTIWNEYQKHCDTNKPMIEAICEKHEDVRQTWTKQFIYIIRLDETLTAATAPMKYPKPDTEYPIKTKEKIYKQNDDVYNNPQIPQLNYKSFYYDENEQLFTRAALMRRQGYVPTKRGIKCIAMYSAGGVLEKTAKFATEFENDEFKASGMSTAARSGKIYKNKYFRYILEDEEPEDIIEVPYYCIIDDIPFGKMADAARYLGCSRQAVSQAEQKNKNLINNKEIIWYKNIVIDK